MSFRFFLVLVVVAGILYSGYWLYRNTSALRDRSTADKKPFSFAKVQLWWWTLVIISCYALVYGITGQFWELNSTCLALLGIGIGTAGGGSVLDSQDLANPAVPERHQDEESEGLFRDILSDETGVSLPRFQALAFNVVYGLAFTITAITRATGQGTEGAFMDFGESGLTLMGVSAAAYLAAKSQENKPAPAPPAA